MSFAVSILSDHSLAVIKLKNAITGPTLVRAIETVFQHEEWGYGYNTLWDAREIDLLDIDASDTTSIQRARQHLKSEMGPGLSVFLVARELDYMLARLFEFTNTNLEREIKTTYSADDAASWLDLPREFIP